MIKYFITRRLLLLIIVIVSYAAMINAQQQSTAMKSLTAREKSIITISSFTTRGDLVKLKVALGEGLDAGLTVNQIKEALVHLYAYCGFPRSIRGLQTFMEVLDERKKNGIEDVAGPEASSINEDESKYERGKKILSELMKAPQPAVPSGYAAFAPVIDTFLKEHLFADIFERDVLTHAQRELITISVISTLGDAEPMLQSHLSLSLNTGITTDQLKDLIEIIQQTAGSERSSAAQKVLDELLKRRRQ